MRVLQRVLLWSLTLLALATAGLWCRSYWYEDQFWPWQNAPKFSSAYGTLSALSQGQFILEVWELPALLESQSVPPYSLRPASYPDWRDYFGSFEVKYSLCHIDARQVVVYHGFRLPHAAIAIPAGLAAFLLHRRERRLRRRLSHGCCTACGYDLTGNTSGVCPECGRNTAARA